MISELKNESYIRTTDMLEEQKMKEAAEEETLGRDAFLTLFTTQLKNQNPLDPMGNEAFVAQLAQFSQVEGIKGMQTSMEDLVSTIKGEQMLAGSQLVGKWPLLVDTYPVVTANTLKELSISRVAQKE